MSEWTVQHARKDHYCTFCGHTIPRGAPYAHIRLTPWDHPVNECFFTWRAHLPCRDLWNDVLGPAGEWVWGEETSEFREALNGR